MVIRLSPERPNLCMVRPRSGDFVVTSKFRPAGSGWAIIVLSVSALALAGCGRKGPLDLPPSATAGPPPIGPDGKPMGAMDAYGQPQAPPGPKKHIFLDNLID